METPIFNTAAAFGQALLTAALLALPLAVWSQSSPKFDVPTLDPQGNFHAALMVDATATYVVEVSTDLVTWSAILTNTPTNGRLDFLQKVENSARFYRARLFQDAAADPPAVFAATDPVQRLTTVITPAGGSLALFDPAGVLYTLSVPTNAVAEPVEISMALVTNLVRQPFADTNWHAVVLEPSGLEFMEPAQITIEYLSGAPDTNVVSFCFSGDGTDFGLVPDRLFANRVEFDVYHFSGAASARMTRAEYQAQLKRRVNSAIGQFNQQAFDLLKPLRDSNTLPAPGEPLPAAITAEMARYYDALLATLLQAENQFMNDCGFLRKSIPALRAVRAVAYRNRLPPTANKARLDTIVCAAIKRCSDEIVAQCQSGKKDTYARLMEWKMIGADPLGCTSLEWDAPELKDCLPAWYGYIHYYEKGGTNFSETNARGEYNRLKTHYALEFYGVVTNSQPLPLSPIAYPIAFSVDVLGKLSAASYFTQNTLKILMGEDAVPCPNTIISETSGRILTNAVWRMTFYQYHNNPLQAANYPPPGVTLNVSGPTIMMSCTSSSPTFGTLQSEDEVAVPYVAFPTRYPSAEVTFTTNSISAHFKTERYEGWEKGTVTGHLVLELRRRP